MSEVHNISPYEEALNKIESLYSSPKILTIVGNKIQDPTVEVNDLIALIKVDAALTADIIQISNSSSYAFTIKSSSLSDAIKRIGFGMITRLIGLSISKSMAYSGLNHYKITAVQYWEDSISQAIMMELLAARCRIIQADAYTIGLMNNVGKVVLNEIMNKFNLDDQRGATESLEDWEKRTIGFTSAYAGAMILKRWNFPTKTCHPILYQHNPPKKSVSWPLHTCLYLTGKILEKTGIGFANADVSFDELSDIIDLLGIQKESVPEIIKEARESFLEITQSLQVV
jgi:HD-like signal output (HDOD) protein